MIQLLLILLFISQNKTEEKCSNIWNLVDIQLIKKSKTRMSIAKLIKN